MELIDVVRWKSIYSIVDGYSVYNLDAYRRVAPVEVYSMDDILDEEEEQ